MYHYCHVAFTFPFLVNLFVALDQSINLRYYWLKLETFFLIAETSLVNDWIDTWCTGSIFYCFVSSYYFLLFCAFGFCFSHSLEIVICDEDDFPNFSEYYICFLLIQYLNWYFLLSSLTLDLMMVHFFVKQLQVFLYYSKLIPFWSQWYLQMTIKDCCCLEYWFDNCNLVLRFVNLFLNSFDLDHFMKDNNYCYFPYCWSFLVDPNFAKYSSFHCDLIS